MPQSPTKCPRMWQNIYIICHQKQMTEILARKTVLMGHISGNALAQPCEYHDSHTTTLPVTVPLKSSSKKKEVLTQLLSVWPQVLSISVSLFLMWSCSMGKSIGSPKIWCSRTNKFGLLYLEKLGAIFSVYSCANGTAIRHLQWIHKWLNINIFLCAVFHPVNRFYSFKEVNVKWSHCCILIFPMCFS